MDKGGMINILFFGGMILILYFFMIRPKNKKEKEQRLFLDSLAKGDKIVTIGGIHGKIVSIDNDRVILELDRGTKITCEKSSLSYEISKKLIVVDNVKDKSE